MIDSCGQSDKEMAPIFRYGGYQTNPYAEEDAMRSFIEKHRQKITGVISVFDRIILKGYLPISYPAVAERFFALNNQLLVTFKEFTSQQTDALRTHAMEYAAQANRPYEYLREHIRKEEHVRAIAQRDGITDGLICVLAINEENHTFSLRRGKGRPHLVRCSPRCLTLYYYFMDRHFGLMHIRLSTWMPFTIQVYVNGHDWLARQLDAKHIAYEQVDNAFVSIADSERAQKIADRFQRLPLEKILHAFANRVNPLLKTILLGMEYYWVIDQAEYATDVMFRDRAALKELYLNMQKHAAVCTQADDIMKFMGRKLHGSFRGTITTDAKERVDITRVKHTVKGNWIKMYNKHGIVLRIETVINRPREFRTFRLARRNSKGGGWVPLPKRISSMSRYAQIGLRANAGYLEALTEVDDPTPVYRSLDRLCEPQTRTGQRVRGLNPLRKKDRELFEAVVRGEHFINGFKASMIAGRLGLVYPKEPGERKRLVARVNRKMRLLRGHGLIARIPHSQRYRITSVGMGMMNAVIDLREHTLPEMLNSAN